jgi:formate-dependent nitrite reductase membrane component NrfD
VSGDVGDPTSRIATLIRDQETTQRKLDKGTRPRVWYIDALPEALVAGAPGEPPNYLWSERQAPPPPVVPGFEPTPDLLTTLDVAHPPQWGWHVWTYLLTKNIAAGAALVAPFLAGLGVANGFARRFVPEIVALAFLALTNFLLVHDLGRPERFLAILFKPNTRSWLVKGAWVLIGFGLVTTLALGLRLVGMETAADAARWADVPLAVLASGYSAWLFAQCRGRDLWLEPGLFPRLVLRALLLGAGLALLMPRTAPAPVPPALLFAVLAIVNALLFFRELRSAPHSIDGRKAHALMKRLMPYGNVPLLLSSAAVLGLGLVPISGELRRVEWVLRGAMVAQCVVALFTYERAWIRAGQEVPLS